MGFVRKKVRQCQFLDSLATQPFHAIKVLQDIFSAGNQTTVIEITKSKGLASTSFVFFRSAIKSDKHKTINF